MAYVLSKKPTFTVRVEITEPGNAPDGATEDSSFIAEFQRLDDDQIKALLQENKPVRAALADLLVGWSGLHDESGRELSYSAQYRDALLKIPHAMVALWRTFLEASSGSVRKN